MTHWCRNQEDPMAGLSENMSKFHGVLELTSSLVDTFVVVLGCSHVVQVSTSPCHYGAVCVRDDDWEGGERRAPMSKK